MPESVSWTYSIRARGGPSVGGTGVIDIDAYEKVSVVIAAGATQLIVLAPGKWADVHGLVIGASDLTGVLAVTPLGATAAVPLDGPIVLVGAGPVALLGAGDAKISFKNKGIADVVVDIFIARDATP